tara:strand:- start:23 stop:1072 length:1050 start_codon:yes stop_codon:yes gene_type:complete
VNKKNLPQDSISVMRTSGIDLKSRWQLILKEESGKIGFSPDKKLLRKSEWWKTGKIGAVHCPGFVTVNGERVRGVLKIQGTKPPTSEVALIEGFAKQNRSKRIRPPRIFSHTPWSKEKQYEAFIVEEVQGEPVMNGRPADKKELNFFFELYNDYRANCRNKPWVTKPQSWSYAEQVNRWRSAVKEQSKVDPRRSPEDKRLVENAIDIVERNLLVEDLEFVHGHFQPGDLIKTPQGDFVLFSNLFWSWRIPFYDAVFGYHWWMLGMEYAKGLTPQSLEKERKRWLRKIFDLPEIRGNSKAERLANLALLERAVPALMVDRYMLAPDSQSEQIITEGARKELKRLISTLSK